MEETNENIEEKFFAKELNVIIEHNNPEEIIIRNTKSGKSIEFHCKTNIDIVSAMIDLDTITVNILARKLETDRSNIIKLLKKLTKMKFLKDAYEEFYLPEDENNNSVSTVSNN